MSTLRASLCLAALTALLVPACAAPPLESEEDVASTEQALTVTCINQKIFFAGACRGEPWIEANLLSTGALFQGAAGRPKGGGPQTSEILVYQQRSSTNFQTIEYTTGPSAVAMNGFGVKHLWTTEYRQTGAGEPELYITRRDPRPAIGSVPAALVTQWWQRTTWKSTGSRETCDSTGACMSAYSLGTEDCTSIGAGAKMIYVPVCQAMVLGSTLAADGTIIFILGAPSVGMATPAIAPLVAGVTGVGIATATLLCPNVGTVVESVVKYACNEFADDEDPTDTPPFIIPPTITPGPGPGGGGGGEAERCPDYSISVQYTGADGSCCTSFSDCTGYGVDADGSCAYDCTAGSTICLEDSSSASCNDVILMP
jgi:hypothetical protein